MHKKHSHSSDLRGLNRITVDAIVGVTDLVETLHLNILQTTGELGATVHKPLATASTIIYRGIRGITNIVGNGLDTLLAKLVPALGPNSPWPGRETILAALNGVLGDYLASSGNPLAIQMHFRMAGQPLLLNKAALTATLPNANGKILVLAHGLCMNDLEWQRNGHDHGAALARQLGYTPVYLHYNSGRHISTNGREFAAHLEALVKQWPVPIEELVILGHSMGGLLTRSAYHYGTQAGHEWRQYLRKVVFLGTPHHGAPMERGGNWFHVITGISSYSAPFSSLGKIRSAGITDLRYGNLVDEDWQGRDRFEHAGDLRTVLPLPTTVQCYAIAATTGKQLGDIRDQLLGDGLVPVDSALGKHKKPEHNLCFAAENQWLAYGTNHLDLLDRPNVYQQLLSWL